MNIIDLFKEVLIDGDACAYYKDHYKKAIQTILQCSLECEEQIRGVIDSTYINEIAHAAIEEFDHFNLPEPTEHSISLTGEDAL